VLKQKCGPTNVTFTLAIVGLWRIFGECAREKGKRKKEKIKNQDPVLELQGRRG